MNSPTSTMPTPSAQTCTGPSTFKRLMLAPFGGVAATSAMSMPPLLVAGEELIDAFPRAQQLFLGILLPDLPGVGHHPEQQERRSRPGRVFENLPDVHDFPRPYSNFSRMTSRYSLRDMEITKK